MKKTAVLFILLLLAAMLAACGTQGSKGPEATEAAAPQESPLPSSAVASQMAQTGQAPAWVLSTPEPTPDSMIGHREKEKRQAVALSPLLSVDLSKLNDTMAYAQMYEMVSNARQYEGKTVRLLGRYFQLPIPAKDRVMHVLVVTDNSLCCEIGMEFVLTGDPVYPDDFPENHSRIDITGMLEIRDQEGSPVPLLVVNEITAMPEG